MARLLQVLREQPRACSYLPELRASLTHRVLVDVSAAEHDALLIRGWRRFGFDYFRPTCPGSEASDDACCERCIPLRIAVNSFAPSKTQRRVARTRARLRVEVGPPRVDRTRLELYRRWHADREAFRSWESSELDRQGYATTFAFPHVAAREFAYFLDDDTTPCAIGLYDETGSTLSAVYFFYDPALKALSLGVINVLHAIDRAKELGITHVYLGFLVEDCPSLAYKAGFRPAERLVGRPDDDEAPLWTAYAKSRREADELR